MKRTSLRPFHLVPVPSAKVLNIHEVKNLLLLVLNEEHLHEMRSFDRGPLPLFWPFLIMSWHVRPSLLLLQAGPENKTNNMRM